MKTIYITKRLVEVIEEKKESYSVVYGKEYKTEEEALASAYTLQGYIELTQKEKVKVVNLSQVKM